MASSHILANLEEWMVAPEQEELVEANLFVVEETYLVRIAEPIPVESSEILVQGEFLGHMEPILEKLERVVLRQAAFTNADFFGDMVELDPENSEELAETNKDYATVFAQLENAHLIFRFAGEFLKGPRISRGKKRSADALGMANVNPSAFSIFNNSSLKTNNVHYGMFWGLDSQCFKRFELPCTLDLFFVLRGNTTKTAKSRILHAKRPS